MEALKQAIDSFKEMLDTFQCPHPYHGDTYRLVDLTDRPWSYTLQGKSNYRFYWDDNKYPLGIYYPLRRGTREMYVTNTHVLLAETYTYNYHVIHVYTVLDRSKEVKREGANA